MATRRRQTNSDGPILGINEEALVEHRLIHDARWITYESIIAGHRCLAGRLLPSCLGRRGRLENSVEKLGKTPLPSHPLQTMSIDR